MAKRPRPYLPGRAFHLTARIQGREHLLTPGVRHRCVERLRRQVLESDLRLLAYVIMSNHLHLVVVQGEQPLGRFMQPFLRSVAWSVQRTHGVAGHVFEGRYRDRVCRDEAHLRNAIAYTHANPVRAGLCEDPADYAWSSHRLYLTATRRPPHVAAVDVARGLEAFVPASAAHGGTSRFAYVSFVGAILPPRSGGRPEPPAEPGDAGALVADSIAVARVLVSRPEATRPSLEVLTRQVLHGENGLRIEDVQGARWPRRDVRRAQARIARAGRRAGYSGTDLAKFLKLSNATISRILSTDT